MSLFVFLLTQTNTTMSPGFLDRWFNNMRRTALLTSLVQYDSQSSLQILATAAGYGELHDFVCMWF